MDWLMLSRALENVDVLGADFVTETAALRQCLKTLDGYESPRGHEYFHGVNFNEL
jgi:hypothetical protein